jgi:hypothetical protein
MKMGFIEVSFLSHPGPIPESKLDMGPSRVSFLYFSNIKNDYFLKI